MNCIECKTAHKDDDRFCAQCGAELGRTLDETVRKKDFRDRQAVEMEITQSVVERLMKWGGWLGVIAALIVAAFGLALGLVYRDTRTALDAGKTQIESAVSEAKDNIATAVTQSKESIADTTKGIGVIKKNADELGNQVAHLRSEINGYKEVNGEMEKLQKQFHGQTTDLTKLDLRVHTLETVSSASDPDEPAQYGFIRTGCKPSRLSNETKAAIWLCAQGSPLLFYQRAANGDLWPIASVSPIGFRDASVAPKPDCTSGSRGTFYVEKRSGKESDKPLVCVKKSDNTYGWIPLSTP